MLHCTYLIVSWNMQYKKRLQCYFIHIFSFELKVNSLKKSENSKEGKFGRDIRKVVGSHHFLKQTVVVNYLLNIVIKKREFFPAHGMHDMNNLILLYSNKLMYIQTYY